MTETLAAAGTCQEMVCHPASSVFAATVLQANWKLPLLMLATGTGSHLRVVPEKEPALVKMTTGVTEYALPETEAGSAQLAVDHSWLSVEGVFPVAALGQLPGDPSLRQRHCRGPGLTGAHRTRREAEIVGVRRRIAETRYLLLAGHGDQVRQRRDVDETCLDRHHFGRSYLTLPR